MSSSVKVNEETDYVPQNILLTGGAGEFSSLALMGIGMALYCCMIFKICEATSHACMLALSLETGCCRH